MATSAANRLHRIIDNVNDIVAIELLSAAQGIDFHHPCKSSGLLEDAYNTVRAVSPHFESDRSLKADVDLVSALIDEGRFHGSCASIMPSAAS
jgi:histidine ammonia-lyase